MNQLKIQSCQEEISLLKNRNVSDWLNRFFIPCYSKEIFDIKNEHFRGLCYIIYGYEDYRYHLTNIYNSDINVLKRIYQNILSKESELYTYKLIEITPKCELLAIDPPRIYDCRVDKTFYLSNISKELLHASITLGNRKMYQKISLRVSNAISNIFCGKYEEQTLEEALERGKLFNIQNIGDVPVTKLYSESYNDNLWVKSSGSEITFEELCETENIFYDSIITQVIHLTYIQENGDTFITHLDHEFIFYDQDSYNKRKVNAEIKGKKLPRLKSFKIDKAKIPLSFPIQRNVTLYDDNFQEAFQKEETVPFIIYVLKSYLNHTDLIDEYFENL